MVRKKLIAGNWKMNCLSADGTALAKEVAAAVKANKFDCDCRKPKPGLLLQAAKDFNINLSKSIMIGDSERDTKAGVAAGCKFSLLLQTNNPNSLLNEIERLSDENN